MQNRIYINWEDLDSDWEMIDINWEDLYIIEEIMRGGNGQGISDYIKGNPWNKLRKEIGPEKTDKFIKIFCKINGIEYSQVVEPKSKIKVKVSHFERVFDMIPTNIKIKK